MGQWSRRFSEGVSLDIFSRQLKTLFNHPGKTTFAEQFRQNAGKIAGITTDKNFKATTNCRNEAMFKEATDFSQHLKDMERDLRSMSKQVDYQFASLRKILISPLPRIYDMGQNGPVPLEEDLCAIGLNVRIDVIADAAQEMKQRLETEVIQPIQDWMTAFRSIQESMKQLEAVRLELDSRRRTVDNLRGQYERMKINIGSMGQNANAELEKLEKLTAHKDEKMRRTSDTFQETERKVYSSLSMLVRDTSVLREYTAAGLQIVQECFAMAYNAYGGSTLAIEFPSGGASGYAAPVSLPSADVPTTGSAPGGRGQDAQAAMLANIERVQQIPSKVQLTDKLRSASGRLRTDEAGNDARSRESPSDQVSQGFDAIQMPRALSANQQNKMVRDTGADVRGYQHQHSGSNYAMNQAAGGNGAVAPQGGTQQGMWG